MYNANAEVIGHKLDLHANLQSLKCDQFDWMFVTVPSDTFAFELVGRGLFAGNRLNLVRAFTRRQRLTALP